MVLLSLPVLSIMNVKKSLAHFIFRLWLVFLQSIQLVYPNPFMPPFVRLMYFIEIFLSNIVFE